MERNDTVSFLSQILTSKSISLIEKVTGDLERITALRRGGVYVRTAIGGVQVGVPPETIKDSMNAGLQVPAAFVVPHEAFDFRMGVCAGEIEFPSYFNFFILRRSCKIVCSDEQARITAAHHRIMVAVRVKTTLLMNLMLTIARYLP